MIRPLLAITLYLSSATAFAAGQLENPRADSNQSGIGIVSGWHCDASVIEIVFDDRPPLIAGSGTTRADTEATCGDSDNGFGLLWNYSLLGEGYHRVRAYADGVEFADSGFTIGVVSDGTYQVDLTGNFHLQDFPQAGDLTSIAWTESTQNFTVIETVSVLTDLKKWQVSTVEQTGGDTIVTATLAAEDISTSFANGKPELIVKCSGTTYDISVNWHDQISITDPYTTVSAANDIYVFVSLQSAEISTLPLHMKASALDTLLENNVVDASVTNVDGNQIDAIFDVRGFDQVYLDLDSACMI